MTIVQINMHEIDREPINNDPEVAWDVIEKLYDLVLKDDPYWHFFYEDVYNIIRFSEEHLDTVTGFLIAYDVTYTIIGEWEDEQGITSKYQDIFKEMFHTFSEMAIKDKAENINLTLDRVIHCFLNHQYLLLWKKDQISNVLWESDLVSHYMNSRSYYTGWCVGVNSERKRKETMKVNDS